MLASDVMTIIFCLLSKGLTGIITVDLHSKEIQGFYDAPVDNLRASPFLVQYIADKVHVAVMLSWIIFYFIIVVTS